MELAERITEENTKTQELAARLAAIPAEIAAAGPAKAKNLGAEWQTVRADRDLSQTISAELQRQETAAARGELAAKIDELTERAGNCLIENRKQVNNLEAVKKKLQAWHNSLTRHSVDERTARQTLYLDMKSELGLSEGKVALSATALRDAEDQRDQARNRLTVFDREAAEETGPTWRPRP